VSKDAVVTGSGDLAPYVEPAPATGECMGMPSRSDLARRPATAIATGARKAGAAVGRVAQSVAEFIGLTDAQHFEAVDALLKDAIPDEATRTKVASELRAAYADFTRSGADDPGVAVGMLGHRLAKAGIAPKATLSALKIAAQYVRQIEFAELIESGQMSPHSPEQIEQALQRIDAKSEAATVAKLRELWGKDFNRNRAAAQAWINSMPEEVRDCFFVGVDDDDNTVYWSPIFWQWAVAQAGGSKGNDMTTIRPQHGQPRPTSSDAILDEIASWEEKMHDRQSDYWKGPRAEKNQARYRELITLRDGGG
jgi:hypothetical protein